MNYSAIKPLDIANGLGIRVSLFVSGCRNHCKGCFNACTWDFNYGKPFTKKTEGEIIEALSSKHVSGLSVLGGEPFEEENQKKLTPFLEKVKKKFPDKDIWCWSGYLLDNDIANPEGKKHTVFTKRMLDCIDVFVDGPFIESCKNLALTFRGSENQCIWKKNPERWEICDAF